MNDKTGGAREKATAPEIWMTQPVGAQCTAKTRAKIAEGASATKAPFVRCDRSSVLELGRGNF